MPLQVNSIDEARDTALAKRGLPSLAYVDNSKRIYHEEAAVIAVKRGESGFYPIHTNLSADELNAFENVTAAQREAMLMGSMFGWHLKGAEPAFHQQLFDRATARA